MLNLPSDFPRNFPRNSLGIPSDDDSKELRDLPYLEISSGSLRNSLGIPSDSLGIPSEFPRTKKGKKTPPISRDMPSLGSSSGALEIPSDRKSFGFHRISSALYFPSSGFPRLCIPSGFLRILSNCFGIPSAICFPSGSFRIPSVVLSLEVPSDSMHLIPSGFPRPSVFPRIPSDSLGFPSALGFPSDSLGFPRISLGPRFSLGFPRGSLGCAFPRVPSEFPRPSVFPRIPSEFPRPSGFSLGFPRASLGCAFLRVPSEFPRPSVFPRIPSGFPRPSAFLRIPSEFPRPSVFPRIPSGSIGIPSDSFGVHRNSLGLLVSLGFPRIPSESSSRLCFPSASLGLFLKLVFVLAPFGAGSFWGWLILGLANFGAG